MAISIEYVELRTEPRTGTQSPVTYSMAPVGEVRSATLVDLTGGGAGLLLDHPIPPGRLLDIELNAASRRARVRWIARQQNGFRVGVSFEAA